VVTKYDVSKGEVVDRDQELFTIVDTTTVWALADVYEKDIPLVARGGECAVTLASYPKEAFKGRIAYLSDALDPTTRTAKLRCVVPNQDGRLKLEMFAAIELPGAKSRTVLAVPVSAVQEINGASVVFVRRGPFHFEKKPVRTGEQIGDWIEIVEGLPSGDVVVTNGGFYLKSVLLKDQLGGEE
jgi:cobalt-zinc-cadmium efflux system membrane fusion protein